jgi:hypothetical protein
MATRPEHSRSGTSAERLSEAQIRAGMAIMQTVFAVAMTLGLREIVDDTYELLFHHRSAEGSSPTAILVLAAFAVTLLGVRFFWVPRNLYSYLLCDHGIHPDKVARNVVFFHFPIALFHAILFFFVCKSWSDVASQRMSLELALQFSGMFGALLLVNALWLWRITPKAETAASEERRPAIIWRMNNLVCALATGALMAICHLGPLFLLNSAIDFFMAAPGYLRLTGASRVPTDAEVAAFVAALSEFNAARGIPQDETR